MGVSPAEQLGQRQAFVAGDDAATAKTYTANIPPDTYEKGDRRIVDDLAPLGTRVLWSVDDDSAISSEFDWALFKNYGGIALQLRVTIDGGTADAKIDKTRVKASSDQRIDGQQASATEALAGFGDITGRVTKIEAYNPHATDTGSGELFMYAEPE
jgi:hypothetical protein